MGFSNLSPYQQNLDSRRGPQRDHPKPSNVDPFGSNQHTFDTKRSTLLANHTQYTGRAS